MGEKKSHVVIVIFIFIFIVEDDVVFALDVVLWKKFLPEINVTKRAPLSSRLFLKSLRSSKLTININNNFIKTLAKT